MFMTHNVILRVPPQPRAFVEGGRNTPDVPEAEQPATKDTTDALPTGKKSEKIPSVAPTAVKPETVAPSGIAGCFSRCWKPKPPPVLPQDTKPKTTEGEKDAVATPTAEKPGETTAADMPTDEKEGGKAPDVVPPADQAAATSTAVVPYEEKGSVKITVDVPPVDKPEAAPPSKPGFFSRWFGSKKAPAPIEATKARTTDEPFVAVVPEEHPGGTVSIDMPTVDEPSRKTSTEVPSPHITSEVVSVDVTSLEKPAVKIEAGVLSAEKPIGEIEGGVFPADKPSGAATVEMFSTDKPVEKTEAEKSGGKTTVDLLSADRP
ncbi:hypothetical protein V5799_033299, partial [Amblyomma americanum]